MPDARGVLEQRLRAAFDQFSLGADPVIRRSDHADFQANGALALAKSLGRNPRELAAAVVEAAVLDDVCVEVEISGPGFINLTVSDEVLSSLANAQYVDPKVGVSPVAQAKRFVVDYSAPNIAKEMHIGHLRSTNIGDAICRLLDFVGHDVIRENHVGDWGTPFAMLVEHLVDSGVTGEVEGFSVADLGDFYQGARRSFDTDADFKERTHRRVVALQAGDPESLRLWKIVVTESVRHMDEVYARLGVLLTDDDLMGESIYNDQLETVVSDLRAKGILVDDDGARCVFPEGFTNRDGDPLPLIVQKSDEGFGYAATDLACIRDRIDRLKADVILYVVGAPQSQHLEMVFATARMAGWVPSDTELQHVAFGNVLSTDRKMYKTREGGTVRLADVLDEAIDRAAARVDERDSELDAQQRRTIATAVGIGAVKYGDLSTERIRDYVFDWDRMLAFEGNTGPYLQYAYARCCSVLRRAEVVPGSAIVELRVEHEAERSLLLALDGFNDAVASSVDAYAPNRICTYLFDLASTFTSFYEQCPVLRAEQPTRDRRVGLIQLTRRVLATGLGLLGMVALEEM